MKKKESHFSTLGELKFVWLKTYFLVFIVAGSLFYSCFVFSAGLLDTVSLTNSACGGDCQTNNIQAYTAGGAQDILNLNNMIKKNSPTNFFIRNQSTGTNIQFSNAVVVPSSPSVNAIHSALQDFRDDGSMETTILIVSRRMGCFRRSFSGINYGFICSTFTIGGDVMSGFTMTHNYDGLGKVHIDASHSINYSHSDCSILSTASAQQKKNCMLKILP